MTHDDLTIIYLAGLAPSIVFFGWFLRDLPDSPQFIRYLLVALASLIWPVSFAVIGMLYFAERVK